MTIRSLARKFGTAVGTPVRFSVETGHFKSSLKEKAVDRHGQPLPWYTLPAIEYLSTLDFSGADVVEFGGGQSTLWWAARCRSLFTIEESPGWFADVRKAIDPLPNAQITCEPDYERMAAAPGDRAADVVIVDGGDRFACARTAQRILRDGGLMVLDNSEGYWDYDRDLAYPIIDLYAGWQRIDFYGFSPGLHRPHCTSIFSCGESHWLRPPCPPQRRYKGILPPRASAQPPIGSVRGT